MKKKLLNIRKHMWVLLVTAMLFGIVLLPVEKVFATETPENAEEQTGAEELIEWFDLGTTETSIPAMGLYGLSDGVTLTGTAEKWIDRMELSGDAVVIRGFYELLEEASDNDGENDYLIEDQYYTEDDYYIDVLRVDADKYDDNMKEKLSIYVRAAFDAFDRDHPEVFWMSGSTYFGTRQDSNGDRVVIFPIKILDYDFDIRDAAYAGNSTYEKEANIKAGIRKVELYVDAYMIAVSGMTTVEQIQYFNRQLTITNHYSTADDLSTIHHECRECISALEGRTGVDGPVCEAYARAFKVLCDEAEIPCVLVDGDAVTKSGSSGPHMWNYVKVEESWYGVDVTWNDPSVSGITGSVSGYEREDYLLVGSSTVPSSHNLPFIESHPVENCASAGGIGFVNGPELAVTAYSSTMPISLKILKGDSEIVLTNEDGTTTGCTTSGNAGNGTWCYENGVLTLNGVTELGDISWYGGNLEIELSGINTGCGKISFNDILEGVLTIQGPGVLEAEEISCLMKDTLYVWVIDSTILLDELTETNTVNMVDSILRNGKYIIVGGTVTLVSEVVIPSDATIFFNDGASSIVNLDMLTVEDGATIKVGATVHNHSMSSVYSVLTEENEKHQKTEVCEGCPIQYKVVTKEDCTFEEVDGTTQCIYCGAKKIQSDSDYIGDTKIGYRLPVSEFEDFDSDVVITVKYHVVPDEDWPNFGLYRELPFEGEGYRDNFLKEDDFVYIETEINDWDMITAPEDNSEVVVVLKKEVAEALTVDEILFPVWGGVVIEEVAVNELSDVDTEIELDTEYPEADEGGSVVSAVIPALNLLQFDGPVAVTLDYMTTGTEEYPSFAANTADWKELSPIGNVTINAEEGTITFVLEEEDVETAIADGGVMFWLSGVYFTKATLNVPTADDYYAGDWNVAYTFTADELAELEGDIIISGEYTILSEANEYDWYGVQFVGASESDWKILNANDFVGSGHINEDDWMGLDANESEFSITLKVGTLKKLKEAGSDLVINTYGVIIQTATLQEVDPDYAGEGEIGYTLPVSSFEGIEGDVVLTVKYRVVPTETWPNFGLYRDIQGVEDYRQNFLKEADFAYLETSINQWDMIDAMTDDSEIVIVLKKEVVEALTVDEILFPVWGGVVIEEVAVNELSDVDTEIELDTEYPEADEGGSVVSAVIPALNLLQFDGPVAVTLDYMTTGTEEYPSFAANTADWKELSPIGNVTINAEEGTITFVLEEEDVETAIADGGVMFLLNGVWFTKATLTVPTADNYYAGDWNVAYTFTAEELEELEGDVVISGEYTTLSEEKGYEWYCVQFVDTNGWSFLTSDDFVESGRIDEYSCMNVEGSESSFSITLKEEALNTLKQKGSDLVITAYGIIVQSAELQEADSDYIGDTKIGYRLSVSEFEDFDSDVVITVKYHVVPDEDWPNFGLYRELPFEGEGYRDNFLKEDDFVYIETEINDWDMITAPVDDSEVVLVLKKEVAEALTVDEILFPVWGGVVIEEVIVSEAQLVGKTGSVIVDDTTNPNGLVYISIPDGVPEDGQVHLVTYEIYDETGTAVGTLEYRACSADSMKASAWITAHGVEKNISFLYDWNNDSVWDLSEPKITYGMWDFGESDYTKYREYTYRVIEDKVLSEKKISAVTELSWDDTKTPGWIVWEPVEGAAGYQVSVVRREDNMPVYGVDVPAGDTKKTLEVNVADRIIESGTYVVRIVTCGGKDSLDSDQTELPAQYVYTRPDVEVGVTKKVWWTMAEGAEVPTVANWTPVVGAKGYDVMLYAYDAENPENLVSGVGYDLYNTDEELLNHWDFAWNINNMNAEAAQAGKTYVYKVSVRALSGNIELLANARDEDTFVSSGEYKTKEAIEAELKTRLEETLFGGSDISSVVDSMGKDEFGDAMKHNQDLQEMLKEAEGKRGVKVNKPEVERALGIDPAAVKAVGAGMNAQSGTVALVLKPAEEEIEVDENLYHNVTQMDISLKHEEGSESTTISELDVPMLITVPAPANINPERMVILHEHEGETELIYPLYNEEKKSITFSVTSFSTFAFAGINLFNESGENEIIAPVEPEELPSFTRVSLELEEAIDINFWIKESSIAADEYSYAVVEFRGETTEVPFKEWKPGTASGEAYHKISFKGVAAKEMRDLISITVYDGSGKALSNTKDYTVGKAIVSSYASNNDLDIKALCIEMYYYGAAAQKAFNYKEDDLATKYLNEYASYFADFDFEHMDRMNSMNSVEMITENEYAASGAILDDLPQFTRVSLELEEAIDINFWIKESSIAADEYSYAVVEFRGETTEVPFKEWKPGTASGEAYHKISFKGVAAKEMRDIISITVYDGNGNALSNTKDYTVGKAIVSSYVGNNDPDIKALCIEMYYYGAAAQKAFNYKEDDLATKYLNEYASYFNNTN